VKGVGGAIGLTQNPSACRRWMLSGPEMARLLKQYEEECIHGDNTEMSSNLHHREQGLSTQKTFQQQVVDLTETIKRMENPFFDIFPDLVTLDSRNCTAESVVTTVRNLEETGKKQYRDFVKNVLQEHSHSIHDPIKKNSLALFRSLTARQILSKGRGSRWSRTMWLSLASCISQCRTGMRTWTNSSPTRFSPSLLHSQISESFIYHE